MRTRPGYSAAQAVEDYRIWIAGNSAGRFYDTVGVPPTVEEIRRHLAGKDLACWCALEQPCHAEVLLQLANAE